jgi:hypothetical protein
MRPTFVVSIDVAGDDGYHAASPGSGCVVGGLGAR